MSLDERAGPYGQAALRYIKAGWPEALPIWRGGVQDKQGSLPGTFVSTARDDGVSGIRLFMVPGDFVSSAWPSQAAVDIDMITWYERYVICSPSIHRTGN